MCLSFALREWQAQASLFADFVHSLMSSSFSNRQCLRASSVAQTMRILILYNYSRIDFMILPSLIVWASASWHLRCACVFPLSHGMKYEHSTTMCSVLMLFRQVCFSLITNEQVKTINNSSFLTNLTPRHSWQSDCWNCHTHATSMLKVKKVIGWKIECSFCGIFKKTSTLKMRKF